MNRATDDEMREYLQRIFAAHAGLPESALSDSLTLADVVAQSAQMHNSVDLIEAFARTANVLERDKGIRVRLPAFSLDTPLSTVLDAIQGEIARQRTETAEQDL